MLMSRVATRSAVLVALVALTIACHERTPTAPSGPLTVGHVGASFSIIDGDHSGNPHFSFLAPLVSPPGKFAGTFDPGANPTLEIRCISPDCIGSTPAEYTLTSGLRLTTGAQDYQANWDVAPPTYVAGATYRVRVLMTSGNASAELGHVDLVVTDGEHAKEIDQTKFAVAIVGQTVPVRFRIEKGALTFIPAITSTPATVSLSTSGGQIASGDGAVSLTVPPGAVSGTTSITVASTTASALPASLQSAAFSSPVYVFGPNGTTFAQPLTLTLAYTLAPGVSASKLGVYGSSNGGPWIAARNAVVDQVAGTVSGAITHFTYYTSLPAASNVVVTPGTATVNAGQQQQFSAALYDDAGNVIPNQGADWTSSDSTIATVDENGLVTTLAQGTVTITAYAGASASVTLTVLAPTVNHWAQASISPNGCCFYNVWASSPTDVYAGSDGNLKHFDGSTWSNPTYNWIDQNGSTQTAWVPDIGVWGLASNDVYAVGGPAVLDSSNTASPIYASVMHFNGSAWAGMPTPTWVVLRGVWGRSDLDIYAVGYNGAALHYDGHTWTDISATIPSGGNTLYTIWGSSASDIYIGGDNGTFLHYNGSSWSSMASSPVVSNGYLISAIIGFGSDLYVTTNDPTAVLYHYNEISGSWNTIATPAPSDAGDPTRVGNKIQGVWGTSPSDLFVGSGGYMMHYNGVNWKNTLLASAGYDNYVVFGLSSTMVYAAGYGGLFVGSR